MRVKSLMSLKVWSNLGPPQIVSKFPKVGRFSENHAKSKSPYLLMGIRRFSDNFPKIYAKTRFSELHERASQASSTQTKQSCERSELRQHSAVFASKAQSEQIKQIKHVSCERSELRQPSAVFANHHANKVNRANQAWTI